MNMKSLPIGEWVPDYTIRIKEKTGEWGNFTGHFLWTKNEDKAVAIKHFERNIKNSNFIVLTADDELALFRRYRKFTGEYKTVRDTKTKRKYRTKEVLHKDWEFLCGLSK